MTANASAKVSGPGSPGEIRTGWRALFSIPLRIHPSWLLLAGLLSASFAVIYTRGEAPVGAAAAVGLGVLTALCLLASVIVHELAHAWAALRSGIAVSGINLKVFGGRTELAAEPERPGIEFRIAAAGPLATLALGVAFFAAGWSGSTPLPPEAAQVALHAAMMNGLLLAVNLIPAIPFDGGRLLRAALWGIWGKPGAATRASAATGRSFGLLLVALGILALLAGGSSAGGIAQLVLGAWFIVVGLHLRRAAHEVTRYVWLAETLRGVTVGHLLDYRVHSVQRGASVLEVAAMEPEAPVAEIPVLDEARLVGAVRLEDLADRSSRPDWNELTAGQLMRPDILERTLRPGDAAILVVAPLLEGRPAVAVLDEGRLVGVVTHDALTKRLALRTEG